VKAILPGFTEIDNRIGDLTRLIDGGNMLVAQMAAKQSNQEYYRSQDSIYALFREDVSMRRATGADEWIEYDNLIAGNLLPVESNIYDALGKISRNLYKPVAQGQLNSSSTVKLSPVFSADEKRQFGPIGETLTDYYNGELVEGARQLQASQNDPAAREIPSSSEISDLIKNVSAERKNAISHAKHFAGAINEIANAGYLTATQGADAWEPLKIPAALRVFGLYTSKNGRLAALDYLKTNYPWFQAEKLHELCVNVKKYLLSVTSERYLGRVTEALASVANSNSKADAWCNALPILRQMRSGVVENRELENNVILFEYMTGIRPREDQIEKINFIINEISKPNCDTGALIQQVMGSGKTKVLLPFIIMLLLNHGEHLPLVVSHISQLPAIAMELPAILSGVGIRMDLIDMDYSQFANPRVIRLLREQLELAIDKRNIVPALSSHTMLALRTAMLSLSGENKGEVNVRRELYVEFKKLFDFFEKHSVALMDEVHLTLNPKESFIIQASEANVSDRVSEDDVTFMADLIHELPKELAGAIKKNTQDQIPAATLKSQLKSHVQEKYCELFNVPSELRQNFARFICGEIDGASSAQFPSNLRNFVNGIDPKLKHRMCLLRKLCSSVRRTLRLQR
jgi:hypothetical protein